MNLKEIRSIIDEEHGDGFHKNIDLDGFVFYSGNSFISFRTQDIEGVKVAVVTYVKSNNSKEFTSLLAYVANVWAGNNVEFVYFVEHKRKSKKEIKFLESIGFKVKSFERDIFKHDFISTNGYSENAINEGYID